MVVTKRSIYHTKFYTQVGSFIPGYGISHRADKMSNKVDSCPGRTFLTQVQNYKPRYKDSFPNTKLNNWV
jgi:hypothetical protein